MTSVIHGYVSRPISNGVHGIERLVSSPKPGDTISFHLRARPAGMVRIDIYQQRAKLVLVASFGPVYCSNAPDGVPTTHDANGQEYYTDDNDWPWPNHDFPIPANWRPGVYVAMFVNVPNSSTVPQPAPAPKPALDVSNGAVLFVVRSPNPKGKILYKLSTLNFQAYNCATRPVHVEADSSYIDPKYFRIFEKKKYPIDMTLYGGEPNQSVGFNGFVGCRVTLLRPGCGIGGETLGDNDKFARATIDRFACYDARFIEWLLSNSYDVDFCTDSDLDEDPKLLVGYQLLLSVGHDEYWTATMMDRVRDFVSKGCGSSRVTRL
jgi:hypothetical protein